MQRGSGPLRTPARHAPHIAAPTRSGPACSQPTGGDCLACGYVWTLPQLHTRRGAWALAYRPTCSSTSHSGMYRTGMMTLRLKTVSLTRSTCVRAE